MHSSPVPHAGSPKDHRSEKRSWLWIGGGIILSIGFAACLLGQHGCRRRLDLSWKNIGGYEVGDWVLRDWPSNFAVDEEFFRTIARSTPGKDLTRREDLTADEVKGYKLVVESSNEYLGKIIEVKDHGVVLVQWIRQDKHEYTHIHRQTRIWFPQGFLKLHYRPLKQGDWVSHVYSGSSHALEGSEWFNIWTKYADVKSRQLYKMYKHVMKPGEYPLGKIIQQERKVCSSSGQKQVFFQVLWIRQDTQKHMVLWFPEVAVTKNMSPRSDCDALEARYWEEKKKRSRLSVSTREYKVGDWVTSHVSKRGFWNQKYNDLYQPVTSEEYLGEIVEVHTSGADVLVRWWDTTRQDRHEDTEDIPLWFPTKNVKLHSSKEILAGRDAPNIVL